MSVFDWCNHNAHDDCIRSFNQFYIDPRTNKPVYTGEEIKCECKKRGCKCYVKPADREVKKPTKRKK